MWCDGRSFILQVKEEDNNVVHCCPELQLQHPVLAERTELKLVSGGLTLKLFKQEEKKWDQLSLSKLHWIKIDPEFFDDLDDDDVLDHHGLNGPIATGDHVLETQVCLRNILFPDKKFLRLSSSGKATAKWNLTVTQMTLRQRTRIKS